MPEGPVTFISGDMSDPDASSLLCKLCQTLVVQQDKMVWHDRSGWRMNVSYTRHDSFPALPVLNMLALRGCSICEFLISVIRRAIEEEIRDSWPRSVANARARPLVLSDGEDAELLVYLVNEEIDIYIGIRRSLPPWFCRRVYRTGKEAKRKGKRFYRTSRGTANSGKGA
jgi:hypothetical protein